MGSWWKQYVRFTYRTEHRLIRADVIMCGVAGASSANGHFKVIARAPQELANVNWEACDGFQLQWGNMAQHVRPEFKKDAKVAQRR